MPATIIFIMARALQKNVNDYDKLTKSKPALQAPNFTLDALRSLFGMAPAKTLVTALFFIVCGWMKLQVNLRP